MAAVHLAAAAEAMSLGVKVGLEPKKLFEIISGAAGSSVMFVEGTTQLLSGVWKEGGTVEGVVKDLVGLIHFSPPSFPISFPASTFLHEWCCFRGSGSNQSWADTPTDHSSRRSAQNALPAPPHWHGITTLPAGTIEGSRYGAGDCGVEGLGHARGAAVC